MSCQELKQAGLAVVHEVTATADLVLYTDGSKCTDGTGAAFWGQRAGAEWTGSLPEWSGVLTAETVAMERAVRWVADQGGDGVNVAVLTDSKGARSQVLHGKGHKSANQEVRDNLYRAAKIITDKGGSVKIGWIPSHCGLLGNERADELAGRGALGEGLTTYSPPTKKETAAVLKECAVEAWQRRWDHDELGRHRYEVDPILRPRTGETRRREEVLWNRLRLGVARLAKWRQTVLQEGDGLCTGCGDRKSTRLNS